MLRALRAAFVVSLLMLPLQVAAQGTIEGTVTDATSDEPLIGAQVVIPALGIGAVTDFDGNYSISNVPAGDHTVEARFIGFRTQTFQTSVADGQTVELDVRLDMSAINLDEVVVTGAGGPVEKRKLGNSIATIDASTLETAPIATFSDVLQGREPGLVGLPSGGQTGEGARIRIRGSASLSQSNEPILYIDGVRANNDGGLTFNGGGSPSRLDDINPESIDRVEILKGAAAATLYGSEASNGVIQVFTKRGNVGPPRFTMQIQQTGIAYPKVYDANTGFARNQAQADTMSKWLGVGGLKPYQLVEREFMEDLYETGYGQTYSASVSGGSPGITYFASARWFDEDGGFGGNDRRYPQGVSTVVEDIAQRAQATASLNIFPTDKLQFRITSNYTQGYLQTMDSNNNIYGVPSLAQFSKPELVRYNNETGTIAFSTVNEAMQQVLEQSVKRYVGSVGTNYRPLDALTIDGTIGVDFTSQKDTDVRAFGWNIDGFSGSEPDGSRDYRNTNRLEVTYDVKGTLLNQITDDIESTLLFGSQGFITNTDILQGSGVAFPGPGFNVTGAAANEDVFEAFLEVANVGVFFQEQIGFRNFLYVTAGGRLDASSAFGSDFSTVFYPKISASFIPSDAPFWQPIGPISSLRFRAALGQSGLQPGAFDALTTYTSLSSSNGPGVAPDNLGNPNLKPEISTEWEFGVESGLMSDRLGFEATYWNRVVKDALIDRQFPVSGGFRSRQLDNIGELKGQGVEIGVNALVYNRANTSVNLFANTAYLWEQISDMGGAPPIKVGGSYPRYRNYLVEGYAPGTHFGAKLLDVPSGSLPVDLNGDGSPDTEAQLLALLGGTDLMTLPSNTTLVLLADDPNPDDLLSGNLTHYLGKPTPDFAGSFGGTVKFMRNFTVSTLFEYKAGNYYVNNLTGAFRQSNRSIGRNTPDAARVERDYMTGGIDANGNPQNNAQVRLDALNDWLYSQLALSPFSGLNTIKKADFLRWREISLTYRVPRVQAERLRLRSLQFTLAGRNLAMWTKYDGVDPELNAIGRGGGNSLSDNYLDGVEAFGWAIPRRVVFTMRMGF
ncbi:MAG: SusC/RagA family TonB-linked outer membrane protein [Rhodothermales bacterium]|nr:SusC/RagA family TonB-linked outer membrane protein [Rhodothermales bacterium]MBO6780901.1 SusC/RagA family TonB-linked outer membrane protein [Rhodothermales bacterium]